MAKFVLRNCLVKLDGTDVSSFVRSVEVSMTKGDVDVTAFGSDGNEHTHGIPNDSFKINMYQDFASSSIHAILSDNYVNETEFVVIVAPTSGAAATTNPYFTADCIILDYPALAGEVGSASMISVTLPVNGKIAIDVTP